MPIFLGSSLGETLQILAYTCLSLIEVFGYVKMEFSGLRFQAFYYESIT